jgi:hypothetical protein
VALAFLIIVFIFVIALLAFFVFPPQKWVDYLANRDKKQ